MSEGERKKTHCGSPSCGAKGEETFEVMSCECPCDLCVETWNVAEEQITRNLWLKRFGYRLRRLYRLGQLDAPELILERERSLLLSALVRLDAKTLLHAFKSVPTQFNLAEEELAEAQETSRDELESHLNEVEAENKKTN